MMVEFMVKGIVFVLLMFLALFLFGCTPEEPEMPSGEMIVVEFDNPENTMWKTYTIEDDSNDLFAEWQEWQENELEQRKWDAYMKNEN